MKPGDHFGRYEIERPLGHGGMGVVHLARDTQMQRPVALKVISHQLAEDAEGLARFHREAETLAQLDSPHIVTIFDHGDVDGTPYLAMQYVAGGDLGTQLKQRGPVPVPMAAAIAGQVAEALADAHAAGVIHRDIKPANVLVRDPDAAEPFVYLGDFGIAQASSGEGLTQAGSVAGSWAYLAPERTKGAPASPASDIYALGCLFHACLTGQAPYVGSDVQMALAHVNEPVPQLPGTDPATAEVNRVLQLTMAKDPAQRYASAAHARADLLAVARAGHDSNPGASLGSGSGPLANTGVGSGSGSGPASSGTSLRPAASGRSARSLPAILGAAAAALVVLVGGTFAVRALTGGGSDSDDATEPTDSGVEAISDPVAGDWNGDGLGDIRVKREGWNDGVEILPAVLLTSDGSAFEAGVEDGGRLIRPITGDVNGDGRPDLVQTVQSEDDTAVEITVSTNTGDGVEESSTQTITWRTDYGFYGLGDFDGDGRDDLLMTRNRGETLMIVAVAHSNGEGFDDPVEYASRGGRVNDDDLFAIGDFDGDGLDDLAARVVNGGDGTGVRFRVLLSTGERFRKTPTSRIDDARFGVADYTAADIDGDGTDELVHLIADRWGTDEYGATLAVQRFVDGSFGTPEDVVAPTSGGPDIPYFDVAASDVDGDGDEDAVRLFAPSEDGTAAVEVYLSEDGVLQEPTSWGEVTCASPTCDSESMALLSSE